MAVKRIFDSDNGPVDAFEIIIDRQIQDLCIEEQGQSRIMRLKLCDFDKFVTLRERDELKRRYELVGWFVEFENDPKNGDHLIILT